MKLRTKVLAIAGLWLAGITALHVTLNLNAERFFNDFLPRSKRKLNVAYIPVT